MARINNLTKYPYDYNITENDFVIGTDGDSKKTKNFPVVALAEYVRNLNNNLSYDRVISIGEITSENNSITINVNNLGNAVYINHTFYSKNTPDTFTFIPVTEGVKIILLYALPDEQIFYMLEGVQSIEAVEPTLPSGALFIQRIIVTADSIEIVPNDIILDNKVQITEATNFAQIGQTQKDFNKNVSDYKTTSDLKNQEQDDRLENLEGINYTWSPVNRTLTLFDNNGTQLSQVSLVSLDNEGTDLRYNATTLSLELYNADNELLDSIPVSSFIGSVGTQLQLNSNQLQLKDSQGNILSTVTFEISNINGLQTALDGKLDKGTYAGTAQSLKDEIDSKQNLLSSFDESIFIENDGNIEGNVSLFEEYFEQQECELNFTPTQIIGVYLNGIKQKSSLYTIIPPKTISVTNFVTNDYIEIQYTKLKI